MIPTKPYRPTNTRFDLQPIEGACTPFSVLEALLKFPGRIFHELRGSRAVAATASLFMIMGFSLGLYGLVIGSLSGGEQLFLAPAKVFLGTLLCMLICLPSLYIFICLSGIDARFAGVAGELLAAVCLMALLLVGFAPVAWVFSQSTDSVALMTLLHLAFWIIAVGCGLALIGKSFNVADRRSHFHLRAWTLIFIIVCLQMMTSLRPIIGRADTILPKEKEFFLTHFGKVLGDKGYR